MNRKSLNFIKINTLPPAGRRPSPAAGGYAITQVDKILKSLEVALLPQEGILWEIEPFIKNSEREILSF
ncbi:hypothetical protein [Nostoc sp. UHCC 0252]|uniref:hypothetical protein n=1 Tax=Nostoc sp. UHCC 0252 TaxID=3110241 RepID=UPI002B21AEE6|nr:hypothetical protein [Nostoc sp. UHCC 0252]MEA5605866.1 hypothetical protein [Nostoc sp. UHCC 0252]